MGKWLKEGGTKRFKNVFSPQEWRSSLFKGDGHNQVQG